VDLVGVIYYRQKPQDKPGEVLQWNHDECQSKIGLIFETEGMVKLDQKGRDKPGR
jgi:hypothetical protein